ncbi:hypothetical protein CYMTET_42556 [Cymbomonas tetramitiformis]|uniref:Uncharacterized protein n=1 Tax=Cymbomonas tetramitiformis TaxID=36881 RepID=A0AAE0C3U2_9CHLO|nr:hypothetical protein CYMTET_42556 [Cymbomonas tetramitiformis]
MHAAGGSGTAHSQPAQDLPGTLLTLADFGSMEDMDRGVGLELKAKSGLKYTGKKDEDREAFVRRFIEYVEEFRRAHESRLRRQTKAASFQALSHTRKDFC